MCGPGYEATVRPPNTHIGTMFFRLLAPSKLGMQNCKVSCDLNPPIESKLSGDNLDSIGGFMSRDTFAVFAFRIFWTSNLKFTVSLETPVPYPPGLYVGTSISQVLYARNVIPAQTHLTAHHIHTHQMPALCNMSSLA